MCGQLILLQVRAGSGNAMKNAAGVGTMRNKVGIKDGEMLGNANINMTTNAITITNETVTEVVDRIENKLGADVANTIHFVVSQPPQIHISDFACLLPDADRSGHPAAIQEQDQPELTTRPQPTE
jgi:hypothetical protein